MKLFVQVYENWPYLFYVLYILLLTQLIVLVRWFVQVITYPYSFAHKKFGVGGHSVGFYAGTRFLASSGFHFVCWNSMFGEFQLLFSQRNPIFGKLLFSIFVQAFIWLFKC